jgi:hypothetical protein
MDHLRNAVPSTLSDLFREESHGCFALGILCGWRCQQRSRITGPSADTLTDDQNRPIKPFNFHDGTRFKCGSTDQDLYKIFMTGLDGMPMPSFADNVKPEEAWELVFSLRTLQPMHTKEKEIAKPLGLKPIDPNAAPPLRLLNH